MSMHAVADPSGWAGPEINADCPRCLLCRATSSFPVGQSCGAGDCCGGTHDQYSPCSRTAESWPTHPKKVRLPIFEDELWARKSFENIDLWCGFAENWITEGISRKHHQPAGLMKGT